MTRDRHRRLAVACGRTPGRARALAPRRRGSDADASSPAGRFSKEYISQIERGKTRPTEATIAWLAERLGVDPAFLAVGVSTEERTKVEALLARAEALSEAHQLRRGDRGVPRGARGRRRHLGAGARAPRARRRGVGAPAARRGARGDRAPAARAGARRAARSSRTSIAPTFSSGSGSAATSSRASARRIALFDEALELAERSGLPCDLLRADILGWRSRCHRLQRDYVAARDDVERALELAQDLGDRAAIANTYFQASLIAQRQGHWVLSRNYAQRAKELYQQLNDERNVGRLLLKLGGLTLLLGDEEQAVEHLKASFARALDTDSPADAAQALEGLAAVHLRPRRVRPGGRDGAQGAGSSAGSGGLPPRSLPVAARTGASADGARAAGRGGGVLPRG